MTQVIPLQRIQYWSVGQNQFYETEALYPMSSKTHYLGICRKNNRTAKYDLQKETTIL
jgi:hypothetical protein